MGFGLDEDLGYLADIEEDNRRIDSGRLTDREKMLDWLEMTGIDFSELSNNEQGNYCWQWRKFGRKEYNMRAV